MYLLWAVDAPRTNQRELFKVRREMTINDLIQELVKLNQEDKAKDVYLLVIPKGKVLPLEILQPVKNIRSEPEFVTLS